MSHSIVGERDAVRAGYWPLVRYNPAAAEPLTVDCAAPDGKLIDSDEALIDYFLDSARVAAVHGGAFGLSPAFRVSYATSEAVLKDACVRIQQACAALA